MNKIATYSNMTVALAALFFAIYIAKDDKTAQVIILMILYLDANNKLRHKP